ncbi:MAG: tRNA (N6-threonylcarbamoyladenosine(37)-N6)-methyltransferase TrmO, partial [Steroidobacteraceae bacterium]
QPRAQDPGREFTVVFTAQAEAQLAWIAARSALPLRQRIVQTLMLGPQPHPYRRIKRDGNGAMRLAVQDWRIAFQVTGHSIEIGRISSGYRKAQLAAGVPDPDGVFALHREFSTAF